MADLVTEIMDKSRMLDVAISEMKRRGQKYAEAERDYRVALAKQMLTERDNGMPVTIISDICKGKSEIAQLRFSRDCAEVLYKSAMEAINSMKLQIRLMDSQLDREWGTAK
jgi:hypothetical protein